MKTIKFDSGTVIFDQGDFGDFAYVVKTGLVQIVKVAQGARTVIGDVGPGGLFGEMALIDNAPRMASAVATEPTTCILVPSGAFETKVAASDPLTRTVIGVLMRNLRSLADRVNDPPPRLANASCYIGLPRFLPEQASATLQRAYEVMDTPIRSARLALEALRSMLGTAGETALFGETLFDQIRRAAANRKLPKAAAEAAETLRGLGFDQSLGSSIWDTPAKASEEAAHLREFVAQVAQYLFATPGEFAALRDDRRKRLLAARAADRQPAASTISLLSRAHRSQPSRPPTRKGPKISPPRVWPR
ncbi:MAG TPA: cyclic nucleotide-binding domain-containing protein [Rhodospirillaceae bacterium]|nr:cyclic nucleotide-binding domain-containing protein [Rhodospirillaceae bacterium]